MNYFRNNKLAQHSKILFPKGKVEQTDYPPWVMGIALSMILAGVLPMPIVFLMRSFQCLKVDLDIHQGSIRRNETTASTKEMIDNDDDVSNCTDLNYHMYYISRSVCQKALQYVFCSVYIVSIYPSLFF